MYTVYTVGNVQSHNASIAGKDEILGGVATMSQMWSCKSHVEFTPKKALTKVESHQHEGKHLIMDGFSV